MVYGLNVVTANEFSYASEPLNGRFAAVRSIDQTDDGGVGCESMYGGRRCNTEYFPTKMWWKRRRGSLIGDFNQNNALNVSARAKEFIENFEPGVHQFVPVDYVTKKGDLLEKRYFWVVCNRIDSLDHEKSTFVMVLGKLWRSVSSLAKSSPELLPDGTDPNLQSKFVFSLSQIGKAHA